MKHSVRERILSNGLKVLFIDVPGSTNFDLAIAVNCGYRHANRNDPAKYELPHILEHQLYDGSKKYETVDLLQDIFSKGGGSYNGITTPYHNIFIFHNRIRNAEELLTASLDMVFYPLLTKKSFDEEMNVIRNELDESMGDIITNARAYSSQQMIPELLCSTDNQLKRLENIVYEDVVKYHKKYYRTKNTTIIVTADISSIGESKLIEIVMKSTQNVNKGIRYSHPAFKVQSSKRNNTFGMPVHKAITDTVCNLMFWLQGRPSDIATISVGLFSYIATNMKSYSVNYRLRKLGLIYDVSLEPGRCMEGYGLDLTINASNEKFTNVFANTLHEVSQLITEGITNDQFENSKQDFIDMLEDETGDAESIMSWYMQSYLMESRIDRVERYRDAIKRVTQETMRKEVAKLLNSENLYGVVFSANAYRQSVNIDMLVKTILKNGEPVSQKLIEDTSIPVGKEDFNYRLIMSGLLILFFMSAVWKLADGAGNLANVIFSGLDFPWSIIYIVYYIGIFCTLLTARGLYMKKIVMQLMIAVLFIVLVSGASNIDRVSALFCSTNNYVVTQAWIFLLLIVFSTAFSIIYYLLGLRQNKFLDKHNTDN